MGSKDDKDCKRNPCLGIHLFFWGHGSTLSSRRPFWLVKRVVFDQFLAYRHGICVKCPLFRTGWLYIPLTGLLNDPLMHVDCVVIMMKDLGIFKEEAIKNKDWMWWLLLLLVSHLVGLQTSQRSCHLCWQVTTTAKQFYVQILCQAEF